MAAPEMVLSEEEAKEYAEAVAMVARHYDVGASAKTLDWFNLGTTMASIYGVRLIGIAQRRKEARSRRPGPGHNGGPAMNGHDAAPSPEPAEASGEAVDFSLMTGPGGRPN